MKFIFISIKIIFIYFISFSSSYSIEAPNIKNLIIYEEKQKIKFFDFLNEAGNKVNLKDFKLTFRSKYRAADIEQSKKSIVPGGLFEISKSDEM